MSTMTERLRAVVARTFRMRVEQVDDATTPAAVRGGARWLLDLGLRSGDRVVLCGENSVTFAVAYFAIHAAGGIAVPIGSDVSVESVQQLLEDCAPSLVLAESPGHAPSSAARPLP